MKRLFIPFLLCSAWAPMDNSSLSLSCWKEIEKFSQPGARMVLSQVSLAVRQRLDVVDLVANMMKENCHRYFSYDFSCSSGKIDAKPALKDLQDFVFKLDPKKDDYVRATICLLPLTELTPYEMQYLIKQNDIPALMHYVCEQLKEHLAKRDNSYVSRNEFVSKMKEFVQEHPKMQSSIFCSFIQEKLQIFAQFQVTPILYELAQQDINFAIKYFNTDEMLEDLALRSVFAADLMMKKNSFVSLDLMIKNSALSSPGGVNLLHYIIIGSQEAQTRAYHSLFSNGNVDYANAIVNELYKVSYKPILDLIEIQCALLDYCGIKMQYTQEDLQKYLIGNDVSFLQESKIPKEKLERLATDCNWKLAQLTFIKSLQQEGNWERVVQFACLGCKYPYNNWYLDRNWSCARDALIEFLKGANRTQQTIDIEKQIIENSGQWKKNAERVYEQCTDILGERITKDKHNIETDNRLLEIAAEFNDKDAVALYVKSILLGLHGFERNVAKIEEFADNLTLSPEVDEFNTCLLSQISLFSQVAFVAYQGLLNQSKTEQEILEFFEDFDNCFKFIANLSDSMIEHYIQRGWDSIISMKHSLNLQVSRRRNSENLSTQECREKTLECGLKIFLHPLASCFQISRAFEGKVEHSTTNFHIFRRLMSYEDKSEFSGNLNREDIVADLLNLI